MNKGNDHQLKMLLIVKQILLDSILGTYKDQYGECTDKCYKIFFLFSFDGSGFVAEHMDLRHFLTIGMLSSGLFTVLFGMGYFWKLHYFAYFVTIQVYTMICLYICTYKIDSTPTFINIYIYIYIFFFFFSKYSLVEGENRIY